MSVTVEDLLRLPSLRHAKVLGGAGGLHKVVSSISVLESSSICIPRQMPSSGFFPACCKIA